MIEIVKEIYSHPFATFFFLYGLSLVFDSIFNRGEK